MPLIPSPPRRPDDLAAAGGLPPANPLELDPLAEDEAALLAALEAEGGANSAIGPDEAAVLGDALSVPEAAPIPDEQAALDPGQQALAIGQAIGQQAELAIAAITAERDRAAMEAAEIITAAATAPAAIDPSLIGA